MENKIEIPDDIQEICRNIAKAAQDSGLNKFECKFTPGFDSKWKYDVHFNWEAGRHGADSNKLFIWSQCTAHTQIETKDGANGKP